MLLQAVTTTFACLLALLAEIKCLIDFTFLSFCQFVLQRDSSLSLLLL